MRITILILALLISIGFNYILFDKSRDSELADNAAKSVLKAEIKQANVRIAKRDTVIARIQEKMDSTHSASLQIQSKLHGAVIASKHKERLSRPDTITLTLTDTVYMAYDSLVTSLTNERNGIQQDCQTLTDSLLSQIADFNLIAMKQESRVEIAEKETVREKKKSRFLKWGLGAAIGVIIYQGIKE